MKSAERKTVNDKDTLATSLTPEFVVVAAALAEVAEDDEGARDDEAVVEILEEPDVDEEPKPLDMELPELPD